MGSACLRWLLRHDHDAIAYDDLSEGNAAAVPDGRLVVERQFRYPVGKVFLEFPAGKLDPGEAELVTAQLQECT